MKPFTVICGVLLIISVIIKTALHIYLDVKNGYGVTFSRAEGYVYWLKYTKQVDERYNSVKRICNIFQVIWLVVLAIFITLIIASRMQEHDVQVHKALDKAAV